MTMTVTDGVSQPALTLPPRQQQVLDLIARGYSNKEIARALGLGLGTVKVHVAIVFQKLGVNRRAAAAVAAIGGRP
jgi:DNA-binding NarL/FixJ family response regulator